MAQWHANVAGTLEVRHRQDVKTAGNTKGSETNLFVSQAAGSTATIPSIFFCKERTLRTALGRRTKLVQLVGLVNNVRILLSIALTISWRIKLTINKRRCILRRQ